MPLMLAIAYILGFLLESLGLAARDSGNFASSGRIAGLSSRRSGTRVSTMPYDRGSSWSAKARWCIGCSGRRFTPTDQQSTSRERSPNMNARRYALVFAAGLVAGCMTAGPPLPAQSPAPAASPTRTVLGPTLILDPTDLRIG